MSKILRLPEVMQRTGLSRSSIYLQMQKKKFPLNFLITERTAGWLESDINQWIESKVKKAAC